MSAARLEKSSRAAPKARAIVAVPKTAERERRAASPVPKACAHAHASV